MWVTASIVLEFEKILEALFTIILSETDRWCDRSEMIEMPSETSRKLILEKNRGIPLINISGSLYKTGSSSVIENVFKELKTYILRFNVRQMTADRLLIKYLYSID